jgi:transposase-like protein
MTRKQRQFTAQFKRAQICRERQLTDSQVYTWRQEFLEKAPNLFETKQTAAIVQNDQAERIAELERLVGQLTMENA